VSDHHCDQISTGSRFLISGKVISLYRTEQNGEAFYIYAANVQGLLVRISDVLVLKDDGDGKIMVGFLLMQAWRCVLEASWTLIAKHRCGGYSVGLKMWERSA